MAFTVVLEHLDGTVLVCPVGELDLATAPVLEEVLDSLVGGPQVIELELSGVTFADCAGLLPIRQALRRAPHSLTRMRLSGARPPVQRVLELTGMGDSVTLVR
jgi:anti-anti-sigma factor